MSNQIIKVLCGSRAYNLHHDKSDYDYHSVFYTPTSELLSLGSKPKSTLWDETGPEDAVGWELGHFLHLACQNNPTVLETFIAPVVEDSRYTDDLRALFPHVLSKHRVYNAFRGYSHNQQKKFLDDKITTERQWKFAVSYIRVLYHGVQLLRDGTYEAAIKDAPMRNVLMEVKAGKISKGDVLNLAIQWQGLLEQAYEITKLPEEPDLEPINAFLLNFRYQHWAE